MTQTGATSPEQLAARQKAALEAQERAQAEQIAQAQQRVRLALLALIAAYVLALEEDEGHPLQGVAQKIPRIIGSPAVRLAERTYAAMWAAFTETAVPMVVQLAAQSAERATEDFTAALAEITGEFHAVPGEVVAQAMRNVAPGAPLHALFDELGTDISRQLRGELIRGISSGKGPREVEIALRDVSGMAAYRSLMIARTEQLRAYREVTLAAYDDSEVVTGWIWLAALPHRPGKPWPCPACFAMHGTTHTTREKLDGHPNCRCTMIPLVEGMRKPRPGTAIFGQLDEVTQRSILGKAKMKAYQAGQITLSDLVGQRHDRRWGSMRYEKSLKAAKG